MKQFLRRLYGKDGDDCLVNLLFREFRVEPDCSDGEIESLGELLVFAVFLALSLLIIVKLLTESFYSYWRIFQSFSLYS